MNDLTNLIIKIATGVFFLMTTIIGFLIKDKVKRQDKRLDIVEINQKELHIEVDSKLRSIEDKSILRYERISENISIEMLKISGLLGEIIANQKSHEEKLKAQKGLCEFIQKQKDNNKDITGC